MYIITNGKIVTENEILEGVNLIISDGKIKELVSDDIEIPSCYEVIDAKGAYVSPGFIDIHSDYIESITSPRPSLLMNLEVSLKECERILCSHGITTMFHSLSFYANDAFGIKPVRMIDNVKKLMKIVDDSHSSKHLIRHRFHARLEVDCINEIPQIKNFIEEDKIHLLSLMDHTPGQGQYRDLEVYRKTLKGYGTLSDDDFEGFVKEQQGKERMTLDVMEELIKLAKDKNIAVASHDDDCVEKLGLVKDLGISISEFPITMNVAKEAKEMGLHTIAGAPNVLLGGSHSGNLSAAEGVVANNIDILCSDYYPAAMLHSIFILHEKYNQDLCEMFKLVTINPAKAVNIDNNTGSIEVGKKADLIIIRKDEEYTSPTVTNVFVDGKLVCEFDYRG